MRHRKTVIKHAVIIVALSIVSMSCSGKSDWVDDGAANAIVDNVIKLNVGDAMQPQEGDPVVGQSLFGPCSACHGAAGEGNESLSAPKLAGLSSGYLQRQLENYKSGIRGTHEDDILGRQMAPMATILVDDAALANVVAYIESLADLPVTKTLKGDMERGEALFQSCVACHTNNGAGNDLLNSPRLAGMSDWYLVNQLKNFTKGIRGNHSQDVYGKQMVAASTTLRSEQDIIDVVAYINSLH